MLLLRNPANRCCPRDWKLVNHLLWIRKTFPGGRLLTWVASQFKRWHWSLRLVLARENNPWYYNRPPVSYTISAAIQKAKMHGYCVYLFSPIRAWALFDGLSTTPYLYENTGRREMPQRNLPMWSGTPWTARENRSDETLSVKSQCRRERDKKHRFPLC